MSFDGFFFYFQHYFLSLFQPIFDTVQEFEKGQFGKSACFPIGTDRGDAHIPVVMTLEKREDSSFDGPAWTMEYGVPAFCLTVSQLEDIGSFRQTGTVGDLSGRRFQGSAQGFMVPVQYSPGFLFSIPPLQYELHGLGVFGHDDGSSIVDTVIDIVMLTIDQLCELHSHEIGLMLFSKYILLDG